MKSLTLDDLPSVSAIHSPEAERAVLGGMLSDEDCTDLAIEQLLDVHFFQKAHQVLFRALRDMRAKNTPIDPLTIMQYLSDRKLTEQAGGAQLLGELNGSIVSVLTFPAHLETVKNKAKLNLLQMACCKAIHDAHERQDEPKAVLDEAESLIYDITNEQNCTYTAFSAKDGILVAVNETEAAAMRGTGLNGPATGFPTLDLEMCGLEPHLCAVIAALSNVGKTQLALSMMKNMAEKGEPSAFISLESKAASLNKRWLSMVSRVPLTTIRRGLMTDRELDSFMYASELIAKWPVKIVEGFGANINDVSGMLRRLSKEGYKSVFIDYLGLISGPEKENKTREIDEVSKALTKSARKLPLALINLVQVNRTVQKDDREPILADLKDSGQIGQDADVVIMMHRKLRDDGRFSWDDGKLKIVKGRDVQVPNIPIMVDPYTGEVTEKSGEYEPDKPDKSKPKDKKGWN